MTPAVLPDAARRTIESWRAAGETIVFTNGVFDLLHRGHVEYLEEARALGDRLVVGLNGDASVTRLKGPLRPLVPADERAELLAALACVDLVVVFEDDTPEALIREISPDVLAKGADWALKDIVGRAHVESTGGRVERIAVREGLSTSAIIARILDPGSQAER
jgi:rfaE bifunctional protein nucleotidyltransferase chain/domain